MESKKNDNLRDAILALNSEEIKDVYDAVSYKRCTLLKKRDDSDSLDQQESERLDVLNDLGAALIVLHHTKFRSEGREYPYILSLISSPRRYQ